MSNDGSMTSGEEAAACICSADKPNYECPQFEHHQEGAWANASGSFDPLVARLRGVKYDYELSHYGMPVGTEVVMINEQPPRPGDTLPEIPNGARGSIEKISERDHFNGLNYLIVWRKKDINYVLAHRCWISYSSVEQYVVKKGQAK